MTVPINAGPSINRKRIDRRTIAATTLIVEPGGDKLVRIDSCLVQLLFEAQHSQLQPAQAFRLECLEDRICLDKSLLQTQLVFETLRFAAVCGRGKNSLGTRGGLQFFFVLGIENYFAQRLFDLAR